MEAVFFFGHRAAQGHGVRIVPPETAVLPGAVEVLARGLLEDVPGPLDIARTTRSVNQTETGPDRVIASEDEAIARTAEDGLHAAAVGLDARSPRVVEFAAVHGAPEVGVKLEI